MRPRWVVALSAAIGWLGWAAPSVTADEPPAAEAAHPDVAAAEAEDTAADTDAVKLEPANKKVVAGFRMEGAAEVEVVFGDSKLFQTRVDRFYALLELMADARAKASHHVHASLATLNNKRRRGCPANELAPDYFRAHQALEAYHKAGAELESQYIAIHRLDELGETAALTPDYRWKVNKVVALYRSALVDFRELKASYYVQLGKEIAYRGCRTAHLLEVGARTEPVAQAKPINPPKPYRRRWNDPEPSTVAALPVTFFVDNRTCRDPLDVYIDGARLGQVAANAKAAFQTLAGRHAMCLIPTGGGATCGQKGTVRTAHIHDGWSISMHCVVKQARK